jgi:tetratricopeptide (TPR) repeat protein
MSHYPNPDLSGEGALFQHNCSRTFEASLRPPWRAALFLATMITLSFGFAWKAFRVAGATSQLESFSTSNIQKALQRDPANSDLMHRLGMVYSFDPTDINSSESVRYLRQTVALNPHRWAYWSDLGSACDNAGDTACADDAYERASGLNPMTPALQWAVGNHYLLTSRPERAFPHFRRLLILDPEYLENTFRLCLRATRDPEAIYAQVVPPGKDAAARFAFLMFLSTSADYENAMKIWQQMITGPDRSPNLMLVKPFLDLLIEHNQIEDAGKVWSDLETAGVVPAPVNSPSANLLYNGGFEGQPFNTGFDWRISDSPDLGVDLSEPSAHQGGKSLRVDFVLGRNAEYEIVDQVVRIKPNTRYQLTAYMRSDNITSNSGPRLREVEMGCADCTSRTSDQTVGTTGWHQVDVEFITQPQTQAVKIALWRPMDRVSSRDITGTVWLDNVTLRAIDASGPSASEKRIR